MRMPLCIYLHTEGTLEARAPPDHWGYVRYTHTHKGDIDPCEAYARPSHAPSAAAVQRRLLACMLATELTTGSARQEGVVLGGRLCPRPHATHAVVPMIPRARTAPGGHSAADDTNRAT